MTSKQCVNCSVTKPLTDFYKKRGNMYHTKCKDCYKLSSNRRYVPRIQHPILTDELKQTITSLLLRGSNKKAIAAHIGISTYYVSNWINNGYLAVVE